MNYPSSGLACRVRHFRQREIGERWRVGNPATTAIVAAGSQLFQLHKDGSIWRSTGAVGGWVMLDNNPAATAIAARGGQLFQLHNDGSIWRSTGVQCSGGACPGWELLDGNPAARSIAASHTD